MQKELYLFLKMRKIRKVIRCELFDYILLATIISALYYKFFLLGRVPFPGDLLVGSYSPWFDYFKIPVQNPLISDVFSQLILWKYLSIDLIKDGQWPLWNPFSFTGNPLLATYQSAALYPLNILLLLPKYLGWGFFIFSQTLLAAFNMYLLLSVYVKSRISRFVGALIFAVGGLMTTWVEQGIPVHGIIWLPLSLYFVEKYLSNGKLRNLFFLTGSLSFSVLAGHFQVMFFSFLVVLSYVFTKIFQKNIKSFSVSFLPITFSMLFAILLSFIQILPSFDLFKKSIRLTESYTGEFQFGLLSLGDFLKFFIADFFGNPVTRNYWGSLNYFETSGFIGTAALPLIIFSFIFLKKNKTNLYFLALLFTTVILTFQNPFSSSIYSLNIPFLTASFASRMLFITVFTSAALSALSLNQIIQLKDTARLYKCLLYSFAVFLGVYTGAVFSRIYFQKTVESLADNISSNLMRSVFLKESEVLISNLDTSIRNSLLPALIILTLFVAFIVLQRINASKKVRVLILSFLLISALTLDLGRYFLKFNPFVPEDLIFPDVPVLDYLSKQPGLYRVGREHAEIFPPNTWMAYNMQSPEGYDPIYLNRYAEFMRFLNGGSLFEGKSSRYAEIASNYYSPYLDIANVKYFLALLRDKEGQIPGEELDWRFKESPYEIVFKDKSAAVLKNPNAMERVYFAKNIITASEKKIKEIMESNKNFDPRLTTILSTDLKIDKVTGKGKAEVLYYSPNIVRIKTDTLSEEILVLSDQYEEGWHVNIDSKKSIISPANLIFRAVKIPPGVHEIVFSYYPESFDLGLKISLWTLAALALGGAVTIWFRKF